MSAAQPAASAHPNWGVLIAIGIICFAGYVFYNYLKANDRLPWTQALLLTPTFLRDPFAKARDVRPLLATSPTPGRLTYARVDEHNYLETQEGDSLLVIGGAGSGKTTGVLAPAARAWAGPAVLVSTTPDLMAETVASRPHAFLVAPGLADFDLPVLGWSPLDAVRDALNANGPDAAWAEAVRTANAMTGLGGNGPDDGEFWSVAAAQTLAPLLVAATTAPGADLSDLIGWVKAGEFAAPLAVLRDHRAAEPATLALTGLAGRDNAVRSRILTSLDVALHAYDDPRIVAAATMRGRFRPAMLVDPGRPGATLYLLSDSLSQARFAPVFAALLNEVIRFWSDRANEIVTRRGTSPDRLTVAPEQRLLLVVDDAADIAIRAEVDALASGGAEHGVVLALGLPDLAPLRERLGEQRADAIVRNCHTRVLTRGLADLDTLQRVNELIGPADAQATSLSSSGRTLSTIPRDVLSIAELRELRPGRAVVLTGTHRPVHAYLLDRSDFAPAPPTEDEDAANGGYPAPMPERRWPFEPR